MSESVIPAPNQYNQDGLTTIHNDNFMDSPAFPAAFQRWVKAARTDYNWQWRVHIGLWAAAMASKVPGDFVECGVNRGFLSSAIMQFLDWACLGIASTPVRNLRMFGARIFTRRKCSVPESTNEAR